MEAAARGQGAPGQPVTLKKAPPMPMTASKGPEWAWERIREVETLPPEEQAAAYRALNYTLIKRAGGLMGRMLSSAIEETMKRGDIANAKATQRKADVTAAQKDAEDSHQMAGDMKNLIDYGRGHGYTERDLAEAVGVLQGKGGTYAGAISFLASKTTAGGQHVGQVGAARTDARNQGLGLPSSAQQYEARTTALAGQTAHRNMIDRRTEKWHGEAQEQGAASRALTSVDKEDPQESYDKVLHSIEGYPLSGKGPNGEDYAAYTKDIIKRQPRARLEKALLAEGDSEFHAVIRDVLGKASSAATTGGGDPQEAAYAEWQAAHPNATEEEKNAAALKIAGGR